MDTSSVIQSTYERMKKFATYELHFETPILVNARRISTMQFKPAIYSQALVCERADDVWFFGLGERTRTRAPSRFDFYAIGVSSAPYFVDPADPEKKELRPLTQRDLFGDLPIELARTYLHSAPYFSTAVPEGRILMQANRSTIQWNQHRIRRAITAPELEANVLKVTGDLRERPVKEETPAPALVAVA